MLSAFLNKEIISDFVFDLHGGEQFHHCHLSMIYFFLKLILSVFNKKMSSAFLNKEIISDFMFDLHSGEEFYHCQ